MRWTGRWLLTGMMAVALAGAGLWARGQLNGCEAPRPESVSDATPQARPVVPVVETASAAPPMSTPLPATNPPPVADAPPASSFPPPPATPPVATAAPDPAPASPPTVVPSSYAPVPPASPPTPAPAAPVPVTPTPAAPPTSATGGMPYTGTPLSPVPTTPVAATPVTCPWTLRVQIIEGKTHLEARTEKEVHFRIVCDRLNLQAPDGAIEAQGTVKVEAPSLEGTCDRLAISWITDRVDLTGQVRVTCRKEGQEVEMTGDKLSVKLTATAQARSTPSPGTLVPTRHEVPEPARPTTTRKPGLEVDPPQSIDPFDGNPNTP